MRYRRKWEIENILNEKGFVGFTILKKQNKIVFPAGISRKKQFIIKGILKPHGIHLWVNKHIL